VAHRVEVHAKGVTGLIRTGLERVLGGPLFEDVALALVKVIDDEVEMQLLGYGTLGPGWRDVVLDALERECGHTFVQETHPLDLAGILVIQRFNLHARNARVEIG